MSLASRPLVLLVLVLASVLLFGCGRKGPEIIPVKGTITFGGGPWPKPGVVYFTLDPSAPGTSGHPALGKFDVEGKLTVTTFQKGDGLVPGRYKLAVECWEIPPRMGSPTPAKSYLPKRYQSAVASGLAVLVESGQRLVRIQLEVGKE
jgi:hypothetical protein